MLLLSFVELLSFVLLKYYYCFEAKIDEELEIKKLFLLINKIRKELEQLVVEEVQYQVDLHLVALMAHHLFLKIIYNDLKLN